MKLLVRILEAANRIEKKLDETLIVLMKIYTAVNKAEAAFHLYNPMTYSQNCPVCQSPVTYYDNPTAPDRTPIRVCKCSPTATPVQGDHL